MAQGKSGIYHVETGKLMAGRYKLEKQIGKGGMGDVWRAYDTRTDRPVAVKVLNPDLAIVADIVKRFQNEVKVINRLDHDGIAIIHDCSEPGERPIFIVLEFLQGPTLAEVLGNPVVPLHPQLILNINLQILDILDAVHEQNIIHRDLKPENVFVIPRGRRRPPKVKLIDFGIAIFSLGGGRLTQVGTVVGTPLYMSPEQCQGLPTVDHRADLYAEGVMLYEMATGRLPFEGTTMEEVQLGHINGIPPRPSEFNPELFGVFPDLEAVILKALGITEEFAEDLRKNPDRGKNPADRFQTAEEFSEALRAAIPEDKNYFLDSQLPSPVNGAKALPPKEPDAVALEPTQPSDPPPPPRPTSAETRRLASSGDDIARAKTVTPIRSSKTISLRGERPRLDTVLASLRRAKAWVGKHIPRPALYAALSGLILGVALAILIPLLPSSGEKQETTRVAVVPDAEVSLPDAKPETSETPRPDDREVVYVPVPVLVPATPNARDEENRHETAEENPSDLPSIPNIMPEPEVRAAEIPIPTIPPTGYAELLTAGRRAADRNNYRSAIAKFKEAALLWREGGDAWEALMQIGEALVIRGKLQEARNLYNWCLEANHLPAGDVVRRSVLAGRLRVLE